MMIIIIITAAAAPTATEAARRGQVYLICMVRQGSDDFVIINNKAYISITS